MIRMKPLIVNEGRSDRDVSNISRLIFDKLKHNFKNFKISYELISVDIMLLIYISVERNEKISSIKDVVIEGMGLRQKLEIDDEDHVGQIEITIYIHNEATFKDYANNLHSELKEVIAHELEHIFQLFRVPGRSRMRRTIAKGDYDYLIGKDEVEGFVTGLYKRAKVERKPLGDLIDAMLNVHIKSGEIDKKQAKVIKSKWINYAKIRFPKAQL